MVNPFVYTKNNQKERAFFMTELLIVMVVTC